MLPEPALSVIIPHLDAPDALNRCLEALARQRDGAPFFEIIVVDNGSAHPPKAVCDLYDPVRLAGEPTPGPGPARTKGARLAKSEFLAFIDCDCVAQPGWISGIVGFFATHPKTDVIGGDVRIAPVDPDNPTAVECYESIYGYRMQLYIKRDHYAATCNMAVRRRIFEKTGDFAGINIAEDVDWGRRATSLGARIEYVPDILITTPARESFQELARKWERHISHDFADISGIQGYMRWVGRALLLMASPLAELLRIARSDRISGLKQRRLALLCLARIRIYRCRQMLKLLVSGQNQEPAAAWRQRN